LKGICASSWTITKNLYFIITTITIVVVAVVAVVIVVHGSSQPTHT